MKYSRTALFTLITALSAFGIDCQAAVGNLRQPPELLAEGGGPLFGPNNPMQIWELERITDDIYGFRYTVYRTFFIVTPEGVIAADPINPEAARVFQEQIRTITDLPVRYVAYSHSHWDHVGGGQVFKDEGATFIAQERCAENLVEVPNPDVVMPDITFKDEYTFELGGKSVTMHYYGPTHDNCLVVMHIQPENLLFVVDFANPPSGWIIFYNPALSEDRPWNMVQALTNVAELIDEEGIETIIGGHITMDYLPNSNRGKIIRGTIGPSKTLAERRDMWVGAIDGVRREMAAGTPPEEVPDKLVAERYMSDQVKGWDEEKMRLLFRRLVALQQTGE